MNLAVHITKRLQNFDLNIDFETSNATNVLALLGASGSGKSLTLGCIAGTVKPDTGYIAYNGTVFYDSAQGINLPPQERHVGYLFQNYALFSWMTVLQNVMVGIPGSQEERTQAALSWLTQMHVADLAAKRPGQLSGGQQQRVALARMLASEPELVLLDEPFSALDGHLRWTLEMALSDELKRFGGGAIYVSHDRDEVYRLSDAVCVIDQGKSEPPQPTQSFFAHPKTVTAALISGCKNISAARAVSPHCVECLDWGIQLETAEDASSATAVGIRAHYILPAAAGTPNAFTVRPVRVIDNTFSVIVMAATHGAEELRLELPKETWAALASQSEFTVAVAPLHVMTLTPASREVAYA